jgi:hypothetical protein
VFFNFLKGKKIVSVFLFSVWSSMPSYSMEKQADNVLHEIFVNLDVKQLGEAAFVCKKWFTIIDSKLFWDDPRLANAYCRRYFGQHGEKVDRASMFMVPSRFRANLMIGIDATSSALEIDLLNHGESRLFPLIGHVAEVTSLASFLLAHHIVNISLVENTLQRMLTKIWWYTGYPLKKEGSDLEKSDIIMAHKVSATLCQDPALLKAYKTADKLFVEERNIMAYDIAKKVYSLNIHSHHQADNELSAKLAVLISLRENSQEDFLKNGFFAKVYNAAYRSLKESNFALSVEQIEAILDHSIDKKKTRAENPYIKSLKRIFDELKRCYLLKLSDDKDH